MAYCHFCGGDAPEDYSAKAHCSAATHYEAYPICPDCHDSGKTNCSMVDSGKRTRSDASASSKLDALDLICNEYASSSDDELTPSTKCAKREEDESAQEQMVRPLVGGVQIQSKVDGKIRIGTVGLALTADSLITAGHAVGPTDSFVGQPTPDISACKVAVNRQPDVDLALIEPRLGVSVSPNKVRIANDNIITVEPVNVRPEAGSSVYLVGSISGVLKGVVEIPNVDLNLADQSINAKSVCVVQWSDRLPQPGDSGGPILSDQVDGSKCYGVYGGKFSKNRTWRGYFIPFDQINVAADSPLHQ